MAARIGEKVLVLQSYGPPPWASWRRRCVASVRDWAAARGYAYRFLGDELFEPIPNDLKRACRGILLPLTDIGRLLWIKDLLAETWNRVIWLDADILIFDAALRIDRECVGREVWLSKGLESGFRAAESVNNCVLSLSSEGALLDRLLSATLEDAASFIAPPHPRALGPDLFRRLHASAPLPVTPSIAMASPLMLTALADGDPAPLAAHLSVFGDEARAANLCGSLIEDEDMAAYAVEKLIANPSIFAPNDPPPPVEVIYFS